jgi:hypothetical protein
MVSGYTLVGNTTCFLKLKELSWSKSRCSSHSLCCNSSSSICARLEDFQSMFCENFYTVLEDPQCQSTFVHPGFVGLHHLKIGHVVAWKVLVSLALIQTFISAFFNYLVYNNLHYYVMCISRYYFPSNPTIVIDPPYKDCAWLKHLSHVVHFGTMFALAQSTKCRNTDLLILVPPLQHIYNSIVSPMVNVYYLHRVPKILSHGSDSHVLHQPQTIFVLPSLLQVTIAVYPVGFLFAFWGLDWCSSIPPSHTSLDIATLPKLGGSGDAFNLNWEDLM